MKENGVFDYGETQPCAAPFSAAAFVNAQEAVEEYWEIFVAHPLARVVEMDEIVCVVGRLVAADAHRNVVAGIFKSVLYQVAEDGVKQLAVPVHNEVGRQFVGYCDIVLFGFRLELENGLLGLCAEVDRLAVEEVFSLFQFVYERHVVDEVGETECLVVAPFNEVFALLVGDGLVAHQYLEVAADRTDRGFQLVGYIVGHLLFQLPVAGLLHNDLLLGCLGFGT